MKQINSDSKGQVMVIAVIIMVILMLGILFLFDLQNVIRSKVKIETADQAAALSAAQWQKESLNLIGELNLIKACDQLDGSVRIPPPDNKNRVDFYNDLLTKMQIRIAFAGPVIAFGAAQQAAKNNGVNIYDYQSNGQTKKQVWRDAESYLNSVATNELRYGEDVLNRDIYKLYPEWRKDYMAMLKSVIDQGVAVRPNVSIGIENVTPYAFHDRVFYNAILNRWWCYMPLRSLLKQPDSYWSGKWWQGILYDNPNFKGQSEIYTLGIKLDKASPPGGDEYYKTVDQNGLWDFYLLKSGMSGKAQDNTTFGEITWCIYDSSRWGTARMDYIGSYWNRSQGGYLSGDIKPSVSYDGAMAYAECSQTINLVNTFESKMSAPTAAQAQASLQGSTNPSPIRTINNTVVNNKVPVGNDSSGDGYPAGVIARTIGHLGRDLTAKPTDVPIILPAFDNVALFPIAMFADNINLLRNTDDSLSDFIIWLRNADEIDPPMPPARAGTELYLAAVQQLNTESFRKTGYNNNFVTGSVANNAYFSDAYKYSATNPAGAGWLQQAYIFTNSDPKYVYDSSNPTIPDTINPSYSRYYFPGSNLYILLDSGGKVRTNEQERCGTGYAPGGSSGPRSGPGRI